MCWSLRSGAFLEHQFFGGCSLSQSLSLSVSLSLSLSRVHAGSEWAERGECGCEWLPTVAGKSAFFSQTFSFSLVSVLFVFCFF